MLILARRVQEAIKIGDDVTITILSVRGNQVRLGIDAPREISVLRQEVYESIQQANILSAKGEKTDIAKAAKLFEHKESKKK